MSYLSFEKLNQHLSNYGPEGSYFIIDKKVFDLWSDKLSCLNDKKVYFVTKPEKAKSFACAEEIITFLLEKGVKRNSRLIAIGGGALSDLAGFCASVVLRGITWEVVPTTLLSMIDASVGGKTGINTPFGKNTVGSYFAPDKSWVCSEFLTTLPEEEFMSGKGELLKYAFLSEKISKMVLKNGSHEDLIKACRNYKLEIVEKDFFEKGERAFLNLGHTFGHALERVMLIPHGVAVAMGIELVVRTFTPGMLAVFSDLKSRLGIEYDLPEGVSSQELFGLMSKDKKNESDDEIVLIVPYALGKVKKQGVSLRELKEKLNEHCPAFIA